MKNVLQKEIMNGIKSLAVSQQYNILGLIKNIKSGVSLPNRLLSLSPNVKDQAMKEIRMALVLDPEKMDF
jgi:hypothetical protein